MSDNAFFGGVTLIIVAIVGVIISGLMIEGAYQYLSAYAGFVLVGSAGVTVLLEGAV